MARTNTLELLPRLAAFDYADPVARLIAADYAEENDDAVFGRLLRELVVERIRPGDCDPPRNWAHPLESPARFNWNRRFEGRILPVWLEEWFALKHRGATPNYWIESRDSLQSGPGACLVVARVVYNPSRARFDTLGFAWQAGVIGTPGRSGGGVHGKPTVRSPEAAVVDLMLSLRACGLLPPVCGPHTYGEDPIDELLRRCGGVWCEAPVRYAPEARPEWWQIDGT